MKTISVIFLVLWMLFEYFKGGDSQQPLKMTYYTNGAQYQKEYTCGSEFALQEGLSVFVQVSTTANAITAQRCDNAVRSINYKIICGNTITIGFKGDDHFEGEWTCLTTVSAVNQETRIYSCVVKIRVIRNLSIKVYDELTAALMSEVKTNENAQITYKPAQRLKLKCEKINTDGSGETMSGSLCLEYCFENAIGQQSDCLTECRTINNNNANEIYVTPKLGLKLVNGACGFVSVKGVKSSASVGLMLDNTTHFPMIKSGDNRLVLDEDGVYHYTATITETISFSCTHQNQNGLLHWEYCNSKYNTNCSPLYNNASSTVEAAVAIALSEKWLWSGEKMFSLRCAYINENTYTKQFVKMIVRIVDPDLNSRTTSTAGPPAADAESFNPMYKTTTSRAVEVPASSPKPKTIYSKWSCGVVAVLVVAAIVGTFMLKRYLKDKATSSSRAHNRPRMALPPEHQIEAPTYMYSSDYAEIETPEYAEIYEHTHWYRRTERPRANHRQ